MLRAALRSMGWKPVWRAEREEGREGEDAVREVVLAIQVAPARLRTDAGSVLRCDLPGGTRGVGVTLRGDGLISGDTLGVDEDLPTEGTLGGDNGRLRRGTTLGGGRSICLHARKCKSILPMD